MDNPIARFVVAALDCPDPHELAGFYSRLTGRSILDQIDDDWVELESGGGPTLAFQQIGEGVYRPPEWPGHEHPQRVHFDFAVPDLDAGEAAVLAIGARKHEVQPRPERWRIFLDPAGHPFCLVIG